MSANLPNPSSANGTGKSADGKNPPGPAARKAASTTTDYERIWERVQKRLKAQLGEDVYSSWFASAKLDEVTQSQIIISVATRFLKHWVENHFSARLMHLFALEAGEIDKAETEPGASISRTVLIRVRTTAPRPKSSLSVTAQQVKTRSLSDGSTSRKTLGSGLVAKPTSPTEFNGHPGQKGEGAFRGAANLNTKSGGFERGGTASSMDASRDHPAATGTPLDPRCTFDAFAVGDSNQFAYRAASELADQRSVLGCRLLYIRGGVGLGKTHLCQAIAHKLCSQGFNTLYLTAEKFMRDFVISLRSKATVDYKEALGAIDCLVVDDIQFLSGQTIQGEFCHVINTLIDSGKTLVVASDRPPAALDSIDARMQSRLSSGLVVEISNMDRQVRRALLDWRREAYQKEGGHAEVTDGVLDKVADLITTNGRDLDGAFNRIIAEIGLNNVPVTEHSVTSCIGFLLSAPEQPRVKIEDIQRATALQFGLTKTDLLSARRTKQIVGPRQIAMYLSKTMTVRSLPDIGRRFGGRDHTTVLHAVRKIEKEIESDPSLHKTIEALKSAILSQS